MRLQRTPPLKTASKIEKFVKICSSHIAMKKLLQCSFYENVKKTDFSAKNSKKYVYYNENMYTNSKFQTQLSRKLQRFRTCRKNKKCSIFYELSEYQQSRITFFPTGLDRNIEERSER